MEKCARYVGHDMSTVQLCYTRIIIIFPDLVLSQSQGSQRLAGIKSARFVLADNNDQVDVQLQYDLLLVGGREGGREGCL